MQHWLLSFAAWLSGLTCMYAQSNPVISTQPDTNAVYLVRDVFVDGDCIEIDHIRIGGEYGQIGTFSNGLASIGLDRGIILSTGHVNVAPGPNDVTNAGVRHGQTFFDPDFFAITQTNQQWDMTFLEFEFVPTFDQVSFEYVFASEEYCEFATTPSFNDAFAFFISGPGINGPFTDGAENIARLPNGQFVSTNTINYFVNTEYYVGNVPPNTSPFCLNSMAMALNETQFDGFTTVLTATANVIPCERYRIKLVIIDRGDDSYDSAVFLNANSFNAGIPATVSSYISDAGPSDNAPYEGCSDVFFVFNRIDGPIDQPLTVPFSILPASTATPGVDYETFPNVVVIPPNQLTDTLRVTIYPDDEAEGVETIILKLDNPCFCDQNTVEVRITDPPPLQLQIADVVGCLEDTIQLAPVVGGGIGPYAFTWETGSPDSTLSLTLLTNQLIGVRITDQCSQAVDTSVQVQVRRLDAQLLPVRPLCAGLPPQPIAIVLSGADTIQLTLVAAGQTQQHTVASADTFWLPAAAAGEYRLTELQGDGCVQQLQAMVQVDTLVLSLDANLNPPTCHDTANGTIALLPSGGLGTYTYRWDDAPQLTSGQRSQLPAGLYRVTATDSLGCVVQNTFALTAPEPLRLQVDSLSNPDCVQPLGYLGASAVGGVPPYSYRLGGQAANPPFSGLIAGAYLLEITDANLCQLDTLLELSDQRVVPVAQLTAPDTLTCLRETVILQADSMANITYQWTGPSGPISTSPTATQLTVTIPGRYQLVVFNQSALCADTAEVEVWQNIVHPTVTVGQPDTLTCSQPSVPLQGQATATATLQWTAPGFVFPSPTNPQQNTSIPGWYYLEATFPDNGCRSLDSVQVLIDTLAPVFSLAPPDTLTCTRTQVSLLAADTPTGLSLAYAWQAGASGQLLTAPNTMSAVAGSGGWYYLQLTNTHNGCIYQDSVEVATDTLSPQAIAVVSGPLTCRDTQVVLGHLGNPRYTYTWIDPTGQPLPTGSTPGQEVSLPGHYALLIQNPDNGCTSTQLVEVTTATEIPEVVLDVPEGLNCQDTIVILNGSASLTFQGQPAFQWSVRNGNEFVQLEGDTTALLSTTLPGLYQLRITDLGNGCSDSLVVELTSTTSLQANVSVVLAQCPGDLGALHFVAATGGTPPYRYSIDNGVTFGPGVDYPGLTSGVYAWQVQDARGCMATGLAQLEEPQPFGVSLPAQIRIRRGETAWLAPQFDVPTNAGWTYQWTPANGLDCSECASTSASPATSQRYQLLATNEWGCQASASVWVIVDQNLEIYAPNVFSPHDQNGVNDYFNIYAPPNTVVQVRSMDIFDRWGAQVFGGRGFAPNDPSQGWDGRHRGEPLNPGLYVYVIQLELPEGELLQLQGEIMLVR